MGGHGPALTCSSQVPMASPPPCPPWPAEGSSARPCTIRQMGGRGGAGQPGRPRQDQSGWARLHCGEGGRGSAGMHLWHCQLLFSPSQRPTQVGRNWGWRGCGVQGPLGRGAPPWGVLGPGRSQGSAEPPSPIGQRPSGTSPGPETTAPDALGTCYPLRPWPRSWEGGPQVSNPKWEESWEGWGQGSG